MDEVNSDGEVEVPPRKNASLWKKMRYSYRSIPDKKQYIEFSTALLTVPVLLTVILLNVNNLRAKDAETSPSPTPVNERIIYVSPTNDGSPSPSTQACDTDIPPVVIRYPKEGETVSDNPVAVSIFYQKKDYCAIVWSYRINNGRWSDFDDKSIALYNLPSGNIHFELRIKSIVTSDETRLTRDFIYEDEEPPTVTPIPNPTAAN